MANTQNYYVRSMPNGDKLFYFLFHHDAAGLQTITLHLDEHLLIDQDYSHYRIKRIFGHCGRQTEPGAVDYAQLQISITHTSLVTPSTFDKDVILRRDLNWGEGTNLVSTNENIDVDFGIGIEHNARTMYVLFDASNDGKELLDLYMIINPIKTSAKASAVRALEELPSR